MKLGKELLVQPIKLVNKFSLKEIDEVLYAVNDICFFFCNKYINTKAKEYIKERFTELGKKLSVIGTNCDRTKRKNELLSKMREIYKSVSSNLPDDNPQQIENMAKYVMAMFVKNKGTMTEDDRIKLMKDNVLFTQIYGYNERISSIQRDLLKYFVIGEE